jgi:hypothetical protein
MKRQIISALVTIALFAAGAAMQRSPSTELSARTAAMQEHSPSALQPEPRAVKQRIVVSTAR